MMALPGLMPFSQEETYLTYAKDTQLDFVPTFYKLAYDNSRGASAFTLRRTHTAQQTLTRQNFRARQGSFSHHRSAIPPRCRWIVQMGHHPLSHRRLRTGCEHEFQGYEDFVFGAVHANEADPIAFWKSVESKQQSAVDFMKGKNQVILRGPNLYLTLSVKGRTFMNLFGTFNMPDGEVYMRSGGRSRLMEWVKFTYPANYGGTSVEGAELTFLNGRVTTARADKNEDFPLKTIEIVRLPLFRRMAIGTNFAFNSLPAIFYSTKRSVAPSTWRSEQATRQLVRKATVSSTGT